MRIAVCRSICIGVVALGESLVFNVASQKNAISDGFCPFITGTQRLAQSLKVVSAVSGVANVIPGFARRTCFLEL